MKISFIYHVKCPNCNYISGISFKDAGRFWISETIWQCEICKEKFTTKELQEQEEFEVKK